MFDRRYEIFLSTTELISHIVRKSDVDVQTLFKFLADTNKSYFLLGKEIHAYLGELYDKGVDLDSKREQFQDLPGGEERSRLIKEQVELVKWFSRQFEVAREKFSKHLSLDQ